MARVEIIPPSEPAAVIEVNSVELNGLATLLEYGVSSGTIDRLFLKELYAALRPYATDKDFQTIAHLPKI